MELRAKQPTYWRTLDRADTLARVAHSSVRWLKGRDNMKPKPFLDDFRQNATKTRQGGVFPDKL
jgi:hypothetical protein